MAGKEQTIDQQLLAAEPRRILDHFEMTHVDFAQVLRGQEGPVVGQEEWGVALYFLVNKSRIRIQEELRARGLGGKTLDKEIFAIIGSDGVKEVLYDRDEADEEGFMTFPSKTVVLAHTDKPISVPRRIQYRMHDKFVDRSTGEELPLLTNVSAPLIQTGNKGVQTYEIFNITDKPMRVNVRNLVCVVDIIPMDHRAQNGTGTSTYGRQDTGVIRVGNPYK